MKNPIIVITGPTASGKTAISFDTVKKFNGEVICADSMTVYRGMDIGTDKPTLNLNSKKRRAENDGSYVINGIKHHLLDELNPDEDFNVAIFCEMVEKKIKEIRSRGNIPFLVGGSLFYIDAFVYDYSLPPVAPDLKLRAELEKKSNDELWKRLVKLDPDSEWTIDKNNKRRLVRALEVTLKTQKPFSLQKSKKNLPKNILYLAVTSDRDLLYEKINKRVDEMMRTGFLDEVRDLYEKYDHSTAMQATGYRQLIEYIEGKINLDLAVEETKKSHRRFAKRQETWLKRNSEKVLIKNSKEAEEKIRTFLGGLKFDKISTKK
ncbi:MAG: tRNA (adenosine(37)-N6)-dimethylallyltransferase MiaA [Patescibacteria group bacterium]|nr:tRNA (adenosine(37)-N6)-dimethylallyltransferase MiaA [Patescibacteria group bacterium]